MRGDSELPATIEVLPARTAQLRARVLWQRRLRVDVPGLGCGDSHGINRANELIDFVSDNGANTREDNEQNQQSSKQKYFHQLLPDLGNPGLVGAESRHGRNVKISTLPDVWGSTHG